MKHLGFDTLSCVWGPCGAFFCCCALALFFVASPVFADEAGSSSIEYLTLDPEAVTGESLGFASAVLRNPSDGSLWIGMSEKGLLRIGRNGRRIRYTHQSGHLPSDHIEGMCVTSEGELFILDAEGEVTCYSSVEGFHSLKGLPGPVVSLSSQGNRVYFLLDTGAVYSLPDGTSPSLYTDLGRPALFLISPADGSLLIAGAGGSVVMVSDGKPSALPHLPEVANAILLSSDNTLWAGTDTGLYHLSEGKWVYFDTHAMLSSRRIVSIAEDSQNRLLVATGRGLCWIDVSNSNVSKSETLYSDETFLPLSLSVDSNHTCYIGGVRGVAAVALDGSFSLTPWVAPEPDGPGPSGHKPVSWTLFILSVLAIFCISFVFCYRRRRAPETPVKPTDIPVEIAPVSPVSPDHPAEQTDSITTPERPSVRRSPSVRANSAFSTSSHSSDDYFKLLDNLDNNPQDSFVAGVYDIIKSSYTDSKLSVEDIAGKLNLTRVHVNRKLQASLGISPSSLLKAYRMRLAASMIMENEIPVSEIASRTGFSSGSYFSSAFKDFFGKSPSEYYSMNK